MGYSRQVYMEAENELNRRHSEAVSRAQQRLDDFYAVCPEAEDVRRRIASTASQAAKAVLRGTDVRASLECGMDAHLSKPIDMRRVLKEIAIHLQKRRS